MRGGGGEPSPSDSSLTTQVCPAGGPRSIVPGFLLGAVGGIVALFPAGETSSFLKHFSHSTGVSLAGAVRFVACRHPCI